MIDPEARWAQYGKPDYAGLLTFAGVVYTEDPAELAGFDVAVVGAPMDDLVSDRPGTRLAPRAIRGASSTSGPHLEAGVDAFADLRVVDFGDAPVIPADPRASHAAIEATVGEVLAAGVLPVVLGGDHSITEPSVRACALAHGGPVGMVHFDTHTDTGAEVFGAEFSHGTFIRRLVEQGHLDGGRYAQIGLRGYWPGPEEFGWQAEHGITSFFMHDVRDLGIREVVARAIAAVGPGPVYLTVDVRRARPRLRPRHRDARAGRDDRGRSPARGADGGGRARAGRRRRRRGHPHPRRHRRLRGARRRPRGARGAHRIALRRRR
jgi:agmatinase